MRDFYAPSQPGTLPSTDQADGLRRLFAGRQQRILPLVANPHVAFSGLVLDQIAAELANQGREVLVVDAAAHSQPAADLTRLDLASGIVRVGPRMSYLAARGLPLAFVDTRGSAAGFLDAIERAAPRCDAVLLHAEGAHLARMFARRAARPLLLAADHPESVKHAYAAAKLLAQRAALMTFDLVLAGSPLSRRGEAIAASLANCLDNFLGALLHSWSEVDPAAQKHDSPNADLHALLGAQLALDTTQPPLPDRVAAHPVAHPATTAAPAAGR
jgi:flagellar biosynthesis protein FlhG